jgi:hypothetical protein
MNQALKAALATASALVMGAAIVAWSATKAPAADLGGNCCSDLEERIAELESTVARKGNRKVKLNVSGWVAEQITYWDDGTEKNMYVGGLGQTLATHVKFHGEAMINADWSAGYVLHIEANTNDALAANQLSDDSDAGLVVRQSYWFVRSKNLGKLGVGRQSSASDNAALLVDGSGSMVPANWVLFDNAGFFLRVNGAMLPFTWGGELGYCTHMGSATGADCNGAPADSVRYDTPTWNGFSASAAWGEDDFWDAALRYSGEFSGFKVAAVAAYSVNSEAYPRIFGLTPSDFEAKYFQAALYVEHVASGVFVYGAYGKEETDIAYFGSPIASSPSGDHWYVKGGVRERWSSLGHTVLYGEYAQYNDMFGPVANFIDNVFGGGGSTEMTLMGLGAVQEIDQAAMSVWLKYRRYQGEASHPALGAVEFDDFDLISAGALINF